MKVSIAVPALLGLTAAINNEISMQSSSNVSDEDGATNDELLDFYICYGEWIDEDYDGEVDYCDDCTLWGGEWEV